MGLKYTAFRKCFNDHFETSGFLSLLSQWTYIIRSRASFLMSITGLQRHASATWRIVMNHRTIAYSLQQAVSISK